MYEFQSLRLTLGCTPFNPCITELSNAYRARLDFVMLLRTVSVVLVSDVRTMPRWVSSVVVSSCVPPRLQQFSMCRSDRALALLTNALVFVELNLYLSHDASAAAMLIMACRSIGEEDNRIISSAQVGTLRSTVPTENPRRLFSILSSRESPLTLKSSVEGMPPWRTPWVSLNSVQYSPSHFTAELIPLYKSRYNIHRSSRIRDRCNLIYDASLMELHSNNKNKYEKKQSD